MPVRAADKQLDGVLSRPLALVCAAKKCSSTGQKALRNSSRLLEASIYLAGQDDGLVQLLAPVVEVDHVLLEAALVVQLLLGEHCCALLTHVWVGHLDSCVLLQAQACCFAVMQQAPQHVCHARMHARTAEEHTLEPLELTRKSMAALGVEVGQLLDHMLQSLLSRILD